MTNQIAPLVAGGKIAGIVPTSIEEVFRLAQAISKSGLAPSTMNTPEKLTVAIMQGMEIGLPPMMAVNRIAVVNGRPTLYGEAIPALLLSRGFRLNETMEGQDDKRFARCEVVRPDGNKIVRTFGVDDAKVAGLWGKQGPWKQYPDRMLQMRARGFAARDGAADVLGGLYLSEEAEDIPGEPKDITPKASREKVEATAPGGRPQLPPVVGLSRALDDAQGEEVFEEHPEHGDKPKRSKTKNEQPAAGGDLAPEQRGENAGASANQDAAQEEVMIKDAKGYATMAAALIRRAARDKKQAVYDDIVGGVEHRLPGDIVASLKSLVK